MKLYGSSRLRFAEVTEEKIPLKQGLKLEGVTDVEPTIITEEKIPLKQGLKHQTAATPLDALIALKRRFH